MIVTHALVLGVEVYLACGLLFALAFVFRGVERVDPAARTGTLGFRLLLLPGCAALWPWLVLRLSRARKDGHA